MFGGQRRLAAIMFTDMVGFSALTQRSERTALALLEEHRGILRPVFAAHRGREVKTVGDGFLIEFDSALEATECAVDIQHNLFERNRRPEIERIEVRIGIHVGDVVHSENDVYGDAVNIASRIEPLAEAGGVSITGPVFEQVRNKLPYGWTPIERAFLKNIEFPVSVYRIELPWQAPRTGRLTPFVDRSAELEVLEPKLMSATHGEGTIIALSGEAGIGKTRLMEELASRAEMRGFRSLRGTGSRAEVATPYAHWSQLVREFARDAPNPLLYKVCANCSREIVQLVPELTERLGPGPSGPQLSPDQAQLRFFEGIGEFFGNVGKESPLVLLLDDLQWADSASLRFLEFFGRKIASDRILVVVAFREPESQENSVLREVLDNLGHVHQLVHRPLKRFDVDGTSQMMAHILGSDPSSPTTELTKTVFEKTGGNPFFLESVAQSLVEEGSLVWTDRGWVPKPGVEIRLPPGIHSLIHQRMKHLDDGTVTTLRIASVLGPQFSFGTLARMVEVPEEELLQQLERGLQSHLLEERSPSSGSALYAFSDQQIRDTLYHELSLVRRGRLHLKAGAILADRGAVSDRPTAGDLAHHFLLGNDPERALTYTIKAAEEASRFYAREEALRHYAIAHDLLESNPQDPRYWQVQEKIAEQLNLLGKPEEALGLRRRVAEEYERLGMTRAAGNIHRLIAREFSVHNEPVRAMEHWERARRLLESGPESVELARLYDTMGGFLYEAGKSGEAVEMCEKALRIAENVNDWQVKATSRMILAALLPLEGRVRVFDYLDSALSAANELEDRRSVPNIEMLQATALLHIRGDGRGALRKLEDALDSARRNHDLLSEMFIKGNLIAYTHFRIGDTERAAHVAEEYRSYAGDDPRRASATANIVLADVALTQGETDKAEKLLWESERLLEEGGDWVERAHLEIALARCALRRRRAHSSIEHLERAFELSRQAGPPALNALFHFEAGSLLVESLLKTGEIERAGVVRTQLEGSGALFEEDLGRAFQLRGDAAWALHRHEHDLAIRSLERTVEIWRKLGWGYELARARSALAQAFDQANQPSRAGPLMDQALEFFGMVGAKADLEELVGRRTSPPAEPSRSPEG